MIYYGKDRASNVKTGPYNRSSIAAVDVHDCTFLTDIFSCHSLHHFSTDFNWSNKPLPSSFTSRVAYILTSSANSLHTQLPSLNISMISLMTSTKSNGPITLPCTIPIHISKIHDKQLPTRVCWVRQRRKLLIHCNRLPLYTVKEETHQALTSCYI